MMKLEVGKLSGWISQANQFIKWAKPYPELAGLAAQLKDRESRIVDAWSSMTAPKKPAPVKAPEATKTVVPPADLEDTLNMLMAQGQISFSQYQEALAGGKLAPEVQKAIDAKVEAAKAEAELTAKYKRADQVHKVVTLDTRLTVEQSHAARRYSGSEYSAINKVAATNDVREMHAAGYYDSIMELDKAIEKSTAQEPVLVYRGVNGEFAKKLAKLNKGDTLTLPAYTSTSSESYVASNFAGNDGIVMSILIPKGAKALSLYGNKLSGHQNEKELLLPRGSHFQVVENGSMGFILKLVRKKQ